MGKNRDVMNLQVKEIMSTKVRKVTPDTTVEEAAKLMAEYDVSYLLIVDDTKLSGIITEDDIIKKVVIGSRSPKSIKVSDIMVKEVIHAKPDTDIEDAADIMTKKKIKKLPIVESNKLIGIITAMDLVAAEPKIMNSIGELFLFAKKQPQQQQQVAG